MGLGVLYATDKVTGKTFELGPIKDAQMDILKSMEFVYEPLPAEKPLNYNLHDLTLTDNEPRKNRKATKKKYRYKKRRK